MVGTSADGTTLPLYRQLKQTLVGQIRDGALAASARIPSERDLCDRYHVSRTTTRRMLSELVHEGWLYTIVGKGTYVAPNRLEQELRPFTGFADDLQRQSIAVASRVLVAEGLKAPSWLATKLGLRPVAPVWRLQRVRFAAGNPIARQDSYLPEHLCPGLLAIDFATRSLYDALRRDYGLTLSRGQTTIKAALATPDERDLLHLGADPAAVLHTRQTTFLADGAAIEYCESTFHGDLYELTSTAWEDGLSTLSGR